MASLRCACHLRGGIRKPSAFSTWRFSIFLIFIFDNKRQRDGIRGCKICFFNGFGFGISQHYYCFVCGFLDRRNCWMHTDYMEEKKNIWDCNTLRTFSRFGNIFRTILGRDYSSKNNTYNGFTLIELLVVIAIIGVLVGGVLISINPINQIRKARDAQRKSDLFHLRTALEAYYNDHTAYPSTPPPPNDWYSSEPGDNNMLNNSGNWIPGLAPSYIQSLPRDPEGGAGNSKLNLGCPSWKRAYTYKSDGQNYALLAHCSMEADTWDSSYALYDIQRPKWAWKVCVGEVACKKW